MATVKAIKYGMKGDDVANLQTTLNNLGYNLDVDGSFGPKTQAAVKDYQAKNNLTVDGMVGPQTTAALTNALSSNKASDNASTPKVNASAAATPSQSAQKQNADKTPKAAAAATTGPATDTTPNVLDAPTTVVNYPDAFSYGDFSYDDYQSSGAVDKAIGSGFSYGDFSYADYAESETVQQAQAALQAALAAQPGAYQSKWQGQIDEIIGRILNREQFSYDVNEDALYQQYADQYARGGKLAMQDTMGQAAAMTGGYGNSYAATVGNQAYQAYLSQLNDIVPELYGMALDRYNAEGQEMYNQYGLLSSQEAQDYGRYQDDYNKWLAERDYAAGRYDSERDYDYGKYIDDRNYQYGVYSDNRNQAYSEYLNAIENAKWQETDAYNKYLNDRNFAYGAYSDDRNQAYNEYLDAVQQAQWGASFDETVKQNAIGNQQWEQNFAETQKQNAIGNQQWETSRQDNLDSEAKAYAREDVVNVIAAGGTPTDAQLAAAGMSKEAAQALMTSYQNSASKSGSGAGESGDTSSYVTDSSKIANWSEAILDADTEEEALRYVERLEQLDPTLADSLYEEWLREHSAGHGITDTTVATPSRGSSSGSGGRGLAGFNAVYKY